MSRRTLAVFVALSVPLGLAAIVSGWRGTDDGYLGDQTGVIVAAGLGVWALLHLARLFR